MELLIWNLKNHFPKKENYKISKYLWVTLGYLKKGKMNQNSLYFDTYMKQTISFAKSKVLRDKINDIDIRISKMESNTDTMIGIVEQIKKIHLPDKKYRTPSGKGINAVRFLR